MAASSSVPGPGASPGHAAKLLRTAGDQTDSSSNWVLYSGKYRLAGLATAPGVEILEKQKIVIIRNRATGEVFGSLRAGVGTPSEGLRVFHVEVAEKDKFVLSGDQRQLKHAGKKEGASVWPGGPNLIIACTARLRAAPQAGLDSTRAELEAEEIAAKSRMKQTIANQVGKFIEDNTLSSRSSNAAKRRAEDAKSLAESFNFLAKPGALAVVPPPPRGAASSSAVLPPPPPRRRNSQGAAAPSGPLDETRRVMLIGPTGHGKSSLVNALLGEEIANTAGSGSAVTCCPTEFYYWKGGTIIPPADQQGAAASSNQPGTTGNNGNNEELPPAPTRCTNSGASAPAELLQVLVRSQNVPRNAKMALPRYKVSLTFLSEAQWFKEVAAEIEEFMTAKRSGLLWRVYGERDDIKQLLGKWKDSAERLNTDDEEACERFRTRMMGEVKQLHDRVCRRGGGGLLQGQFPFRVGGWQQQKPRLNMLNPEKVRPCEMLGQGPADTEQNCFSLEPLQRVEAHFKEVLEKIEVGSDFPLLRVPGFAEGKVRLGDVPGFGDSSGFRERIAQRCLEGAQKILICSNSVRAGSDKQVLEYLRKDAVKSLQMRNAGKNTIVFVATKSDQAKLSEMGGRDVVDLDSDDEDEGGPEARRLAQARKLRKGNNARVRGHVRDMVSSEHFGRIPVAVVSSERWLALMGIKRDESSAPELDEELTEIPALACYLVRSLYAECALEHVKKIEETLVHCGSIRLRAEQKNQENAASKNAAHGEIVRKVIDQVLKSAESQPNDQDLKQLSDNLKRVAARVDPSATQANNKAPQACSSWAGIRWNTYCAALRREGEWKTHNFPADLLRPFTEHMQADWSGFFDHYAAQIEQYRQDLKTKVAAVVEEIVSGVKGGKVNAGGAASSSAAGTLNLPQEVRNRYAAEIKHRVELLTIDGVLRNWNAQKTQLFNAIQGAQELVDEPKELLKERYGPEFQTICTSEAGTGSDRRRKNRMQDLFASGCEMKKHVEGMAEAFETAATSLALFRGQCREQVFKGVAAAVKRGSWAVEDDEECAVCMTDAADVKEWKTFFRCVHRCCSICMQDLLSQGDSIQCHYCREVVPASERALIISTPGGAAGGSTDEDDEKEREEGKMDTKAIEKIEEELGGMKTSLKKLGEPVMVAPE